METPFFFFFLNNLFTKHFQDVITTSWQLVTILIIPVAQSKLPLNFASLFKCNDIFAQPSLPDSMQCTEICNTLLKMKLLSNVLLRYECVHNSVSRTSEAMYNLTFTWRHEGEMGLVQTNHSEAVVCSRVFKVSCTSP